MPEQVPAHKAAESMFDQFEQDTHRMTSGVDSQLRTPDKAQTLDYMKGASQGAYFQSALPGGSIHNDYETKIAERQAVVANLENLYNRAQSDSSLLFKHRGSHGLDGESEPALMASLKRKLSTHRGLLTKLTKEMGDLRRMAEDYQAGKPIKISEVEKRTAPDPRKTARQEIHDRYHAGAASIDEIISNPDFQMTAKSDTGDGEVRKFVGAPDWVGNDPSKLRKLFGKLVEMAEHGENAKHWYDYSSSMIKRITRGDLKQAEKLAQLIAIYSPNSQLDDNIQSAIRVWHQYQEAVKKGEYVPLRGGMTTDMDRTAEQILYGGADWGGRKTNNFYVNLMKRIDPSLRQGVTVDIWAKRPFEYHLKPDGSEGKEVDQPSDAQYGFIENMYSQVAKEMTKRTGTPWTPDQVQAAIWTSMRAKDTASGAPIAQRLASDAQNKLTRMAPDAPRLARLLEPGELDRRLQGAANQFYGLLKAAGQRADEAFAAGHIGTDQHRAIHEALSKIGEGYDDHADPGEALDVVPVKPDTPASIRREMKRARDIYEQKVSDVLRDYDLARKWENAKATLQAEGDRASTLAQEMLKPSDYNFMTAAQRIMSGQLNMEMIPAAASGFDLDGLEHAPYRVKEQFSRELYPVVQEVLGKLGVSRGPQGDIQGFGDWAGEINPMFGIGLLTPRAVGGGTPDPTKRTDNFTPAIDQATERQVKLAAAVLAYVLRQHGVAYMNMKPLEPHKRAAYGIKDADLAQLYGRTPPKPGDDRQVYDDGDLTDKANMAHFEFVKGNMPMDAWAKLLEKRGEVAEKYGFDPGTMPLVPTADGRGFAALNLTGQDWHEGKAYSNREFQKIVDEIVQGVDDADARWDTRKRMYANGGGMDFEPWEDTAEGKAGENLRRIIRELGGDEALSYADHLFESRVRPVFEKWKGWRSTARPTDDGEPEWFERVAASEAAGLERTGGASAGDRGERPRPLPLSLSERDQAVCLIRRLKARRLLLGEHASKPPTADESHIIGRLRELLAAR